MEQEPERCDVSRTGVCAMHDVTVERRRGEQEAVNKSIRSIEKTVTELDKIVKSLVKNFYIFLGTTALISAIIIASFVYTRDTGEASKQRDAILSSNQETISQQVSTLAVNMARTEGMQSALISELREFTKTLKEKE